jgi:hypothetical protein
MTRPFFVKNITSDFDKFDRHADIAIAKMQARSGAGYAIDFQVTYRTTVYADVNLTRLRM